MDGFILRILKEDGRIHFTDTQRGWTEFIGRYSSRMDGVNIRKVKEDGWSQYMETQGGWTEST